MIDLAAKAYMDRIQTLNEESLGDFLALLDGKVRFKDPFNEGVGIDYFHTAMDDMFEKLENVRFDVDRYVLDNHQLVMHWRYSAKQSLLGEFQFDGVSWVTFNNEGKVIEHIDYWDSAELLIKVPLLGSIVKAFKRRAAI